MIQDSLYNEETQQYKTLREQMKGESTFASHAVANIALKLAEEVSPPLRVQVGKGMSLVYRLTRWFPQWMGNSLMNWVARRSFKKA